jgi:hypothetical protein
MTRLRAGVVRWKIIFGQRKDEEERRGMKG